MKIVIVIIIVIVIENYNENRALQFMKPHFSHEDLDVYQTSIQFVSRADEILDMLFGLIRSTSTSRVYERSEGYGSGLGA